MNIVCYTHHINHTTLKHNTENTTLKHNTRTQDYSHDMKHTKLNHCTEAPNQNTRLKQNTIHTTLSTQD